MSEVLEQMKEQWIAEGFKSGFNDGLKLAAQAKSNAQTLIKIVQALLIEGSFSLEKIAYITGVPLKNVTQLKEIYNNLIDLYLEQHTYDSQSKKTL